MMAVAISNLKSTKLIMMSEATELKVSAKRISSGSSANFSAIKGIKSPIGLAVMNSVFFGSVAKFITGVK